MLVQDGAGENNPAEAFRALYFEALKGNKPEGLALGGILEIFTRTSPEGEPFAAVPAPPEGIGRQLAEARKFFDYLAAFSLEYLEP